MCVCVPSVRELEVVCLARLACVRVCACTAGAGEGGGWRGKKRRGVGGSAATLQISSISLSPAQGLLGKWQAGSSAAPTTEAAS